MGGGTDDVLVVVLGLLVVVEVEVVGLAGVEVEVVPPTDVGPVPPPGFVVGMVFGISAVFHVAVVGHGVAATAGEVVA